MKFQNVNFLINFLMLKDEREYLEEEDERWEDEEGVGKAHNSQQTIKTSKPR